MTDRTPASPIFDAHLDLAYLAETGRDLHTTPDQCRGRYQPAVVTLPAMAEAGITHCLGTIFTEGVNADDPDAETGAFAYPFGDADAAWRAGQRQLKLYQAWQSAGLTNPMPRRGQPAETPNPDAPLRLGVLIECADPITSPDELEQWADAGVVAIGMAWWHQGRYASGNGVEPGSDADGLTDLGRALVPEMDRLGLVHDLSHLSQRSVEQLFDATDAPVIASHSNCRALLDSKPVQDQQRHLADETIKEIARRGGVVGLNLVSNFLDPDVQRYPDGTRGRAPYESLFRHIDHVCELTGSTRHVALGTDADGGFSADGLLDGINALTDLHRLADTLAEKGWSDEDVRAFLFNNWTRYWGLPDTDARPNN